MPLKFSWAVFLVLAVWTCGLAEGHDSSGHHCVHGQMQERVVRGVQTYANIDSRGRRRSRRSEDDMEPIRMFFYTLDPSFQAANETTKEYTLSILEESRAWIASALKVNPVQGGLTFKRQCRFVDRECQGQQFFEPSCGEEFPSIPVDHLQAEPGADPPLPGGAGVSGADVVVYVTLQDTAVCQGGDTLAYALACNRDQIDRPTFGHINFCPVKTAPKPDDPRKRLQDVATAIHEIIHILGFSTQSFALFRDIDLNPRTARCPEAAGCASSDSDDSPPRGVIDSDTLRVTQEGGRTVQRLVTPEVRRLARAHFGCESLEGLELEDEGGTGTALSHWEKRRVLNEFMVGLVSKTWDVVKSTLTLALLKDSGWYAVNYDAADVLLWGAGEGCGWGQDTITCAAGGGGWCPASEVGDEDKAGCTFDRRGVGQCREDPLTNECAFVVAYTNVVCDAGAACLESTLIPEGFTSSSNRGVGCYEVRCVEDADFPAGVLHVRTPGVGGEGGTWHSCKDNPQPIAAEGYTGTLSCPAEWSTVCYDTTAVVPPDVDECQTQTHNCDALAACRNSDGSFSCRCAEGFEGAGTTGSCTDVNECSGNLHDCHVAASCTNSPGSFACACNSGFSGSGRACEDEDECAAGSHDCSSEQTCANTFGGFTCSDPSTPATPTVELQYFIQMAVRLPYSLAEFDAAKQAAFRRGIAAAFSTTAEKVTIDDIKEAAESGRRRALLQDAGQVDVSFSVEVASEAEAEALEAAQAWSAANLNAALQAEDLEAITGASAPELRTVTITNDPPRSASPPAAPGGGGLAGAVTLAVACAVAAGSRLQWGGQ